MERMDRDAGRRSLRSAKGPPLAEQLNPLVLVRAIVRERELLRQFTRREIEGRYRGSFLGLLWSFVTPVVLLAIYTFVFGVVFKARWPQGVTGDLKEFALVIFCGLTVFNLFAEPVTRAAGLVIAHPGFVKKVVFPLEILPVAAVGAALFHGLVSLAVLLAASVLVGPGIPPTALLLPVVILPALLLALGLAWFLAALGVFIRDVGQTVSLVVQVLVFLTPVFYPIEAVPPELRALIRLNPLASAVEGARSVLIWGHAPAWGAWAAALAAGAVVAQAGFAFFQLVRRGFGDVV